MGNSCASCFGDSEQLQLKQLIDDIYPREDGASAGNDDDDSGPSDDYDDDDDDGSLDDTSAASFEERLAQQQQQQRNKPGASSSGHQHAPSAFLARIGSGVDLAGFGEDEPAADAAASSSPQSLQQQHAARRRQRRRQRLAAAIRSHIRCDVNLDALAKLVAFVAADPRHRAQRVCRRVLKRLAQDIAALTGGAVPAAEMDFLLPLGATMSGTTTSFSAANNNSNSSASAAPRVQEEDSMSSPSSPVYPAAPTMADARADGIFPPSQHQHIVGGGGGGRHQHHHHHYQPQQQQSRGLNNNSNQHHPVTPVNIKSKNSHPVDVKKEVGVVFHAKVSRTQVQFLDEAVRNASTPQAVLEAAAEQEEEFARHQQQQQQHQQNNNGNNKGRSAFASPANPDNSNIRRKTRAIEKQPSVSSRHPWPPKPEGQKTNSNNNASAGDPKRPSRLPPVPRYHHPATDDIVAAAAERLIAATPVATTNRSASAAPGSTTSRSLMQTPTFAATPRRPPPLLPGSSSSSNAAPVGMDFGTPRNTDGVSPSESPTRPQQQRSRTAQPFRNFLALREDILLAAHSEPKKNAEKAEQQQQQQAEEEEEFTLAPSRLPTRQPPLLPQFPVRHGDDGEQQPQQQQQQSSSSAVSPQQQHDMQQTKPASSDSLVSAASSGSPLTSPRAAPTASSTPQQQQQQQHVEEHETQQQQPHNNNNNNNNNKTTRFLLASPTQKHMGAVNPAFFYVSDASTSNNLNSNNEDNNLEGSGNSGNNKLTSSERQMHFDRVLCGTHILRTLIEASTPESVALYVAPTQAACELLLLARGETALKLAGAQVLAVLARQLWTTMRRASFGSYHEGPRRALAQRVDLVQALHALAFHGLGTPSVESLHGRYAALIAIGDLSACLGSWLPETRETLFALLHVLNAWFRGPPEPDLKTALVGLMSSSSSGAGASFSSSSSAFATPATSPSSATPGGGGGGSVSTPSVARLADRQRDQQVLRRTLRAACDQLLTDPPPIAALTLDAALRDWVMLRVMLHSLASVAAGTTTSGVGAVVDAVVDFLTENKLWFWCHSDSRHSSKFQSFAAGGDSSSFHFSDGGGNGGRSVTPEQQARRRHSTANTHRRTLSDAFSGSAAVFGSSAGGGGPAAAHFSWVVSRAVAHALQSGHSMGHVFLSKMVSKLHMQAPPPPSSAAVSPVRLSAQQQQQLQQESAERKNKKRRRHGKKNEDDDDEEEEQRQQQQPRHQLCIFERIGLIDCLTEVMQICPMSGNRPRDIAEALVRSLHTGKLPPRAPPKTPLSTTMTTDPQQQQQRRTSSSPGGSAPRGVSSETQAPSSSSRVELSLSALADNQQLEDSIQRIDGDDASTASYNASSSASSASSSSDVVHDDGELDFLQEREQHSAVEAFVCLAKRTVAEKNFSALGSVAAIVLMELRRLFQDSAVAAAAGTSSLPVSPAVTPLFYRQSSGGGGSGGGSVTGSGGGLKTVSGGAAQAEADPLMQTQQQQQLSGHFVPLGVAVKCSTEALWSVLLQLAPLLRHLSGVERKRLDFVRRVAAFFPVEPLAPRVIALYLAGGAAASTSSASSKSSSAADEQQQSFSNNNSFAASPVLSPIAAQSAAAAAATAAASAPPPALGYESLFDAAAEGPDAARAIEELLLADVYEGCAKTPLAISALCDLFKAYAHIAGWQHGSGVRVAVQFVFQVQARISAEHDEQREHGVTDDAMLKISELASTWSFAALACLFAMGEALRVPTLSTYARDLALRRREADDLAAQMDLAMGEDGNNSSAMSGTRGFEAAFVSTIHSAPLVPSCFRAPHLLSRRRENLSSTSSSKKQQQHQHSPLGRADCGLAVVHGTEDEVLDDMNFTVGDLPGVVNRETVAVYLVRGAPNRGLVDAVLRDVDSFKKQRTTRRSSSLLSSSQGLPSVAAAEGAAAAAAADGDGGDARSEDCDGSDDALSNGEPPMFLSPSAGSILAVDDARAVEKLCSF